MLIADAMISVANRLERDLAVLMRQRDQLASRVFLRSAAFIRIDVGIVTAQHGVVRPVQSLQAQHVRSGPVEGKEDVDPLTEVLFEFRDSRSRKGIVAVRNPVSLIGPRNRFQNFRMYPSIIVAGKAASGIVQNLRHTEIMYQSGFYCFLSGPGFSFRP